MMMTSDTNGRGQCTVIGVVVGLCSKRTFNVKISRSSYAKFHQSVSILQWISFLGPPRA
jgi:hypothetical protein